MNQPAAAASANEAAVEEAIALCGGDARAAVRALLEDVWLYEHELAVCRLAVSSGYSRQWHHNRWRDADTELG